ncbi:MAG TPA: DUF115 domain-containing protein [Spirochaetia bacterium]|nr:DUF115 domain-containing protein [Spirochaetia bacterium]
MNGSSSVHFHSLYNPKKEAERFVANSLKDKKPGVIIVIGPGENYIKDVLDTSFSYAKKYYIQPCSLFDTISINQAFYWSPASSIPLKDFLHQIVYDEFSAAGIAVLEWEPVTRYFAQESNVIRNELAKVLAATASEKATIAYWSKRWLINSIKFSSGARNVLSLNSLDKPIAILAAGPGLSDYINFIKANKNKLFIICIASALPAILEHDIYPDAVFLSDPGYWNTFHTRLIKRAQIPIIMPPSARIPTDLFSQEFFVVNTNLIFERFAIQAIGCPSYYAKAFGTSVGTALDFALHITNNRVLIFGFDLASYDIVSHVIPYSFLTLSLQNSSRLTPFYARQFSEVTEQFPETINAWRFSRSFNTYAQELPVSDESCTRIIRFSKSPMIKQYENLAVITKDFDTYDFSFLNYVSNEVYITKNVYQNSISIKTLLQKFFAEAIQKLQNNTSFGLTYDEILFFKALSIKKFNETFALAIRNELKQETINHFIEASSEALSAILSRYCSD